MEYFVKRGGVGLDVFYSYFTFCFNMIVPLKKIKIYPESKPWIRKEVKAKLYEKRMIFQSNDRTQLKAVQRQLNKVIDEAKRMYKVKLENLFRTNRSKDAWKGLKAFCGYNNKTKQCKIDNVNSSVDDIN